MFTASFFSCFFGSGKSITRANGLFNFGRETPFKAKISLFRHKIGHAFVFREFWIEKFWQHLVSRTF